MIVILPIVLLLQIVIFTSSFLQILFTMVFYHPIIILSRAFGKIVLIFFDNVSLQNRYKLQKTSATA